MTGKGNNPQSSNSGDFENEARERLATIETQHDNLEEKVDGLHDGQDEILDTLNAIGHSYVEENDLDPLHEEVEKNSEARERAYAVAKFLAVTLTILGGFSGVIVIIL